VALARRRSGESGFRINCGEDLWLTDKAIHRLRGILDRGGASKYWQRGKGSIGAQREGEQRDRVESISYDVFSCAAHQFRRLRENRNKNKSYKTDILRGLGGRGIDRVERMGHRRSNGERRKGKGEGE
jgi:hypothetical protein